MNKKKKQWICKNCKIVVNRFDYESQRPCPKCGKVMTPFVVENENKKELKVLKD